MKSKNLLSVSANFCVETIVWLDNFRPISVTLRVTDDKRVNVEVDHGDLLCFTMFRAVVFQQTGILLRHVAELEINDAKLEWMNDVARAIDPQTQRLWEKTSLATSAKGSER